jgi:hypothetical protein
MGEQSWWASGAQRPACWHRLWEHSQQLLLTQGNQAFWLAPSVTLGAVGALGLASKGHQFPSCFRVKVAGPVLEGSMELQVPVCARKQDLLPSQCQEMEPGTTWRLQRQGMRSVDLRVLPILTVVICFSICGFRESYASRWLCDPLDAFWGSLIFLLQGS